MDSRPDRSRRILGTLLFGAAVVLLAWWFLGHRRLAIELLVPVTRESRIPLLLHLDRALQERGYPPDTRWVRPLGEFPEINVDDPGVPIEMPPEGAFSIPELPVHREARLRFGIGFERVEPGFADVEATFRVVAERDGEPRTLFEERLRVGEATREPRREWREAPLPAEFSGGRVTLRFETAASRAAMPREGWLPVFLSPVLASEGVERRVETLERPVRRLVADLVAGFDAALDADDDYVHRVYPQDPAHCFAVRLPGEAPGDGGEPRVEPLVGFGASAAVEADERPAALRGGSWPALVFDADAASPRFLVEVPEDGAELDVLLGVDYRSHAVGSADFWIDVDGKTVLEDSLDPATRPDDRRWHRRVVDLGPWAGRTVSIVFRGEVFNGEPATLSLAEAHPLGTPVPYELKVMAVRAAFARARVFATAAKSRRLAALDRPSVVVVNVECFRADAPSFAGGPAGISPALDRLAAEGTVAAECLTVAPWTSPSVASFFTGLYPPAHGVVSYVRSWLPDSVETLAERALQEGVTTAAFVTNGLLGEDKNFDQGFETAVLLPYANARQVVATFEDWLADHADLQFLAYLHLFEPHHPCNAPGEDGERYVPEGLRGQDQDAALARVYARLLGGGSLGPEADDVRILRGRYLGEVRYVDRQLERLRAVIEAAGLTRRVVVIVTGDHGEEFLEHGLIGHGSHLYRESVHVPLVLWGPGHVEAGRVIHGAVENASLCANVLDFLRVPYDRAELRPPVDLGGGGAGGGRAYLHTRQGIRRVDPPHLWSKAIHAVQVGREILHYSPPGIDGAPARYELYDLALDPLEQTDLAAEFPQRLDRMRELLRDACRLAHLGSHGRLRVDRLDARTQVQLRQLAYASGSNSDAEDELCGGD